MNSSGTIKQNDHCENDKPKNLSFEEVIVDELKIIQKLRISNGEEKPENVYKTPENLVGLAFSGGGIRSATFGLGVLEAMKNKGLLTKIDYLSTVSGGGYIGSWLSANCLRQGKEWLAQEKYDENNDIKKGISWKQSITHLRRYSNYLSPNLNLLSQDTWTMFTVWLRNTVLIQLMVVFAIALLLLIAKLLLFSFDYISASYFYWCYGISILSLLTLSFAFFKFDIQTIFEIKTDLEKNNHSIFLTLILIFIGSFCFSILFWLEAHIELLNNIAKDNIFSAKSIITYLLQDGDSKSYIGSLKIISILDFPILLLFYVTCLKLSNESSEIKEKKLNYIWAPLSATAVLAFLLAGVLNLLSGLAENDSTNNSFYGICLAYVWSPILVIGSFSFAFNILIGIWGSNTNEYVRECWSRVGAWLAIIGFSWMVIVIFAIYGPFWSFWFYYEGPWKSLGSGWALTTLAGLFASKSADTGSSNQQTSQKKLKDILARITPFVFIAGLLIIVSTLLHVVIANMAVVDFNIDREHVLVDDSKHIKENWNIEFNKGLSDLFKKPNDIKLSRYEPESESFVYTKHWELLAKPPNRLIISIAMVLCLICVCGLGLRVDINEFSLNAFYRIRLARCYLGASRDRKVRNPHPFTGFDKDDDLKLAELVGKDNSPSGPFHIVNCALNLGGSSDLSVHTRHSTSFTLTPLYSGSSYEIKKPNGTPLRQIGYISTQLYTGDKQPTLGQAISVSGAAASPNMGYHTSAPVAFLMTLFNARLGWWFPSPIRIAEGNSELPWYAKLIKYFGINGYNQPSPSFSLKYLVTELFGIANEKSDFLAISDGGHFENLAAYELVKRKCKVVIISDGECDPEMQFEGLANLIRICEVDRLAKIEIDVSAIKTDGKTGWSSSCCAVGKINYAAFSENKTVPPGWLIYVKAAMTGHEDTAIMQYKATHMDFPHETTGDQFYAEDQFESYRNLGKDITGQLFNKWESKDEKVIDQIRAELEQINKRPLSALSMEQIGKGLYSILSPENVHQTQSIFYADRLIEIWKQLSEDEKLSGFDINTDAVSAPIFYFCNEIIQLMENIYLDLNFEETWDREENIGWVGLFKEWACNPNVNRVWDDTKLTYGIKFKSFWERKLNRQN